MKQRKGLPCTNDRENGCPFYCLFKVLVTSTILTEHDTKGFFYTRPTNDVNT